MVRGRFCAKQCGPSRRHVRSASPVLENFARHPKRTFSTLSARNGLGNHARQGPLIGQIGHDPKARTIPFLTTDNDIRWGIPAKSIEPLASLSNKRCDGLSVAEVQRDRSEPLSFRRYATAGITAMPLEAASEHDLNWATNILELGH